MGLTVSPFSALNLLQHAPVREKLGAPWTLFDLFWSVRFSVVNSLYGESSLNLRTTTSRSVKRFRGGLVFKAHRLVCHSLECDKEEKKKSSCTHRARRRRHARDRVVVVPG